MLQKKASRQSLMNHKGRLNMTREEFFAEFDKAFDELNNLADLLFPEEPTKLVKPKAGK